MSNIQPMHILCKFLSNQPAGLKEGDLPLLLQVSFVANHQDDNGRAGQRPRVCQPVGQTIERLPEFTSGLQTNIFDEMKYEFGLN